jgi:cytoskeletal protein CcmA (bactofilin family)
MNTLRRVFSLVSTVGIAGVLVACGSGGDGPTVGAGASASGSAGASGTITGFGSLFINGKKFETENVEVRRDGVTERCTINPVTTCGFKKGMVVTVNGSFSDNQHTASSVQQKDAVEGLVQSVAGDGLSLVVMGQTVLIDNTTLIDDNIPGRNIGNLVAGTDNVEVNGHIRPNGIIQATFIEKKLVGVTPEVRGFVNNHASGSATFRIGTLTVNYSGADISDIPVLNGNNWDGRFVEVKGSNLVSATTTLIATKVEPENQGLGNTIDEFEVEGFVTQAGTPNGSVIDFSIGTTPVRTTASTEFRGGTVDEIVVGVKLSAEGRFDGSTLITKHVKFHESVRLEGDATVTGSTLTLTGLPGVTITVNSQTELKDGGNTITVDDLQGNHVRVRGRVIGPNTVVATRIQLRLSDNDVDLQGPVQAIAGNVITILGLSVDGSAINQFESVSGTSMSRAGFLAEVRVNSLVKVKGKLSGTTVAWEEAELED